MSYFTNADCRLETFAELCARSLDRAEVPFAADVAMNVPVYDATALAAQFAAPESRRALMTEWARVLKDLSGVLVLKRACPDTGALDAATGIFKSIIAAERAQSGGGADHFAAAGANDRIWNALQKLCLADPEVFARCFASPAIDAVCEAWLGRGYQMTAQVNLVRPGGGAQDAHRDYHLGFMTAEEAQAQPIHAHLLSPVLTLQGAVAHCDMPIESGPTRLLPFSQLYEPGYLAYRLPEFRAYFADHFIQLPLEQGDAVFFNPALFHAAGDNRSADIERLANLLQVSSPMGRAMETVDRSAMVRALYPVLARLGLPALEQAAAIAASAEGYAFPTNLDTDPPVGGLAPETQAALMDRALKSGMRADDFEAALAAQDRRRQA